MPRISGVDIPNNKVVRISLRYLYGIGPHLALQLCKELNIDPNLPASKLSDEEVARIASVIDRKYTVEGQLRRQIAQNIARYLQLRQRPGAGIDDLHYDADPFPLGERHANQAPDIFRRCRFS